MKHYAVSLSVGLVALAGVAMAEPAKVTGVVTDIFGPRFVLDTVSGKVLVDIGQKGAAKVAIKAGEKIEVDGDRHQNELRARRVTMSDGHAYEMHKRSKSWREWLGVQRAADMTGPFGPAEAKKLATDKGYQVTGDPVAARNHFAVMASRDGKSYELQVHRDGRIDPRIAFGAFDARKVAADKGYLITSEPIARRHHFRAIATKGGKSYAIDLHRDGRLVQHAVFGADEAKQLVAEKGYEMVGELRPVDEHFELLAKKDSKFFELHAHRDGKLVRARSVDATDPKWGPLVR